MNSIPQGDKIMCFDRRGAIHQNELYDKYFNSRYSRINRFDRKEYERVKKAYEANYEKFLPQDKNSNVLDVGCGTGFFLYYLKKKGYKNYYGIDISKDQIDYCRQEVTENVVQTDAFGFLKDKIEEYDVIVMNDLLEHIPKEKLIDFLRLVRKALRAHGIAIIRVPNMANPFGLISRYSDMTHETGFTESSLYQLLKVCNFKEIKLYPTKSTYTFKFAIGGLVRYFIHLWLKLLFLVQGYTIPKILTMNLIATARK